MYLVAATVVDWVQAVGTLGAVAAALGIAWWGSHRVRHSQPALSLAFDASLRPPDFMAGMLSDNGAFESHWVRLRVENASGKRSADDVEVLFIRHDSTANPATNRTLDVVPLRWSSTEDHSGKALTRITIPPGLYRHVDLLAIGGIAGESVSSDDARPIAAIQVQPTPTDDRHLLPEGSYIFHLAVAARDTDAAFFKLEVKVPGERLNKTQIQQCLTVLPPVREQPPYAPR